MQNSFCDHGNFKYCLSFDYLWRYSTIKAYNHIIDNVSHQVIWLAAKVIDKFNSNERFNGKKVDNKMIYRSPAVILSPG